MRAGIEFQDGSYFSKLLYLVRGYHFTDLWSLAVSRNSAVNLIVILLEGNFFLSLIAFKIQKLYCDVSRYGMVFIFSSQDSVCISNYLCLF